ncbi:MAG TPA: hypothetical protein VK894_10370, partial [Jiangellales bacterium]|nr:hypothetical protein [Jiangellales bacterium]
EQITLDAERYGYTTKGGTLKPGWVVITDVYQIIAGIVVGSDAKTKTFSITGAGNAVNDLVDGQAGGGFSYTSSTVTDDLWYVTFPGDPVSLNADGTGVDPSTVGSTDKLYTVGFQAVGMENGVITPYRRGSLLTPPVPV